MTSNGTVLPLLAGTTTIALGPLTLTLIPSVAPPTTGTPPPVPAPQRYPVAIRNFLTYQNQPGDANHILTSPDPNNPGNYIVTDLTLDAAKITHDLQTEILSLEEIVGIRPFLVPKQPTLGLSVNWLHNNLSPGIADPNNFNNIGISPPSHNHTHADSSNLTSDDHPQYMLVNGTRGFSAPVTAAPATRGDELITLSQAQPSGLTAAQVQSIIQTSLANTSDHPITGPTAGRYRMSGGSFNGPTDVNGNIYLDFGTHFSRLITFVFMKMPFPGGSMLGWYAYQYMEDQLVLLGLSNTGATIQFIEDIAVDRQALVSLAWMAVGV